MERYIPNTPQPKNKFTISLLSTGTGMGTGNAQGVAFDGTYYYWTADNYLRKYTRSGDNYTLVASKDCTLDAPTAKTQLDNIDYYGGYLWVGANDFGATGSIKNGWIIKYDTSFNMIEYFPTLNHWCECGVWKDVGDGEELWVLYSDYDHCSRYKKISGIWTHINDYLLPFVIGQTHMINLRGLYQGALWYGDYLICQTHMINTDTETHVYKWNGNGFDGVERYRALTGNTGQGIAWESYGNVMLFAERGIGGATQQRILRAQFTINP